MKRSKRSALLIAVLVVLAQAPDPASAEWFADLYAGSAFTQKHDVDLDTLGILATFQDVTFDTSFVVGGRGGYWFESGPLRSVGLDIGLGLDVSYFTPDVSKQTRTLCAVGFCATAQFADFDLSVTTIGFDVLLRYPLLKSQQFPKGQLQPYVTAGPALFIAHAKDSTNFLPARQSDTDTSVGVKVGAGAAWQFQKNWAVFGEYRFTHFSPEFTLDALPGIKTAVSTDVNTHFLLAGVSFRY